ncbi:hypothetical protein COP1_003488 [Malus domestica]
MAGMGFLSCILFAFLFHCRSQVAHSQSSPSTSKMTMLDVAASIQKTLRALSSKDTNRTAQALSQQDHSSLSVSLHSRISLYVPSHSHYKSLTLA